MEIATLWSGEFNQRASEAKKGANKGPAPLLSHKLKEERPESTTFGYNGKCSQTVENKGRFRPWPTILQSSRSSSN